MSAGTANVANQGVFFGTSSYAYCDPSGYVRAVNYNSDPGALTTAGTTSIPSAAFVQATGDVTAQAAASFTDLNLVGNRNFILASGATLTVNGILQTGDGASTISGGVGLQPTSNADFIIRTDQPGDALTIGVPILANGSNLLVKTGAGTLTLGGANTFTGAAMIDAGALVLAGNNSARPAGTTGLATVNCGGTLQLQANAGNTVSGTSYALSAEQTAGQPLVLNNGATLQLRSDSSVTFAGANNFSLPGGGAATIDVNQLTASGSNQTLTLAPGGFATNNTTINVAGGNGYTLALGPITNGNSGSFTLNATANASLAAIPASVTAFAKGGPGALVLAGTAFASTGPTTVSGGHLTISGSGNVNTSAISISNGAQLAFTPETWAPRTAAFPSAAAC